MVLERQTSAAEREMVKELARRRQRITFARDPIKVLSLFAWVCADAARSFVDWLVHHRRTGLYPLITLVYTSDDGRRVVEPNHARRLPGY